MAECLDDLILKSVNKQNHKLTSRQRLFAVENITKNLITSHRPTDALQTTIDYIINELKIADIAIVWSYDPSNCQLIAKSVSGIPASILKPIRINQGDVEINELIEKAGNKIQSTEEVILKIKNKMQKMASLKVLGLNDSSPIICLPLVSSGFSGMLTFINLKNENRFNHSDLLFFQIITNLLIQVMEKYFLTKAIKDKEASAIDDRYKAALIPTLAHEMRTPLTSIKGYSTALLMEEAVFSPERRREFLEIIDRECDNLVELISDYLESSSIDAGMLKITLQPVRLPQLVQKSVNEVGHRFPKHSLIVDFPPDFPLIDIDPDRILQVLRQLLDNAAKYSPEGGMIVLQGRTAGETVIISVADEGVGIAPEDLNHLFDRFFRAKSNSGSHIIGTGLGLPISRAIIAAHGGNIWAASQLGQGSKFFFTLPLKGPSLNRQSERDET